MTCTSSNHEQNIWRVSFHARIQRGKGGPTHPRKITNYLDSYTFILWPPPPPRVKVWPPPPPEKFGPSLESWKSVVFFKKNRKLSWWLKKLVADGPGPPPPRSPTIFPGSVHAVWSGNTTILQCRPTHSNVRKSHKLKLRHRYDN